MLAPESSRLLLKGIQALNDNVIFMLDPQGRMLSWNDAASRLMGYTDDDLHDTPISILYGTGEDQKIEHVEYVLTQAKDKKHFTEDVWWKHKEGKRFLARVEIVALFDETGNLENYTVAAQDLTKSVQLSPAFLRDEAGQTKSWGGTDSDISDLKAVQEALRQSNEKLKMTLDAVHIGIWQWDIATNKVVCDEDVHNLFGVNKEEQKITDIKKFIELIHPEDRARINQEIQKVREEINTFCDVEFRTIWQDKSIHHIASRFWMYKNHTNKTNQILGLSWDISEHKKLEEEKVYALERAKKEETQRVRDAQDNQKILKQFVNALCHELRNPLNGIYGSVNILKEIVDKLMGSVETVASHENLALVEACFGELDDFLDILGACAEQLKSIIDEVLTLSKLSSKKETLVLQNFNPKTTITTAVQMFMPQLTQKNIVARLNLPEEDFWVEGDPARLMQIITNLLSNAVKFTHEGSITLSLSYRLLNTANQAVELSISVHDTGIGMTQEEQQMLFEEFGQAHAKISLQYGGSGLGLSIAKQIVELMGGQIQVESKKGEGTRFDFTVRCQKFTLEKPKQPLEEKVLLTKTELRVTPKYILIVEDNKANQAILAKYLRDLQCRYEIASDGRQAVELCKQHKFDVIFMDIKMPDMDGLSATKEIRKLEQQKNQTPSFIVGLSGDARQKQKQAAFDSGMNDYLTKPYRKNELIEMIVKSESIKEPPFKKQKTNTEELSKYAGVTAISKFGEEQSPPPSPARSLENTIEHTFKLADPNYASAKFVHVAGSFNNWLNAVEGKININNNVIDGWRMEKTVSGEWMLNKPLPLGYHEYKFVIDGERWYPVGDDNNLVLDLRVAMSKQPALAM